VPSGLTFKQRIESIISLNYLPIESSLFGSFKFPSSALSKALDLKWSKLDPEFEESYSLELRMMKIIFDMSLQ
jgi:hypothetical protein